MVNKVGEDKIFVIFLTKEQRFTLQIHIIKNKTNNGLSFTYSRRI